jgi:hypothetical protein
MLRRTAIGVLMILSAAAGAAAQPADPDSATIHIGPLGITPSLLLRDIGRDENVFNDRDNPKSDFTMTIVPRAEVILRPAFLKLAYTTATEYVYYRTYESERSINQSSTVRADFLLARFEPYVLASGLTTRARLNSEVDARARHNERTYGAGASVKVGTRATLGGGWRTSRQRFDDDASFRGRDLREAFDSTTDLVEGTAGLQLTTFTQLTLAISHERQRFIRSPERDAESFRVVPTFTFSPDAVLSGSVSVGYRRFTPRSERLSGYGGLVAAVNVTTTLLNRHHLALVVGRDLRYSYEQTTPYYLATGATATLTTELVGPFDVRVMGSRQLLAYRADRSLLVSERPGDDTVTSYGGGFGYRIRERIRLGLDAEWTRRSSELSTDREYRGRRIFASLSWGAQ